MTTTAVSRIIRAPRCIIYAACLDPEALIRWRVPDGMTAQMGESDMRAGGRYRMTLTYANPESGPGGKTTDASDSFTATFVKLVPDECVVEHIVFDTADPNFAGTMTLTTRLRDVPGGTEVSILCENLPVGVRPQDNELGCEMSLKNLARLVE